MQQKAFFTSLKVIAYGYAGGLALMTISFYFINQDGSRLLDLPFWQLAGVQSIITAGSMLVSAFIYRTRSEDGAKLGTLADKKEHYKKAVMSRLFTIDISGIIAGFSFYLTGEYKLMGFVGISIAALILNVPSQEQFKRDYALTPAQEKELG